VVARYSEKSQAKYCKYTPHQSRRTKPFPIARAIKKSSW